MPTIESHRLGILSNSEVQELYGLPQLSEQERHHYFDMSATELAIVQDRSPAIGIVLALELGYFKARAQFFSFALIDVVADLQHLARRHFWGLDVTTVLLPIKKTRLRLQSAVLDLTGYRVCTEADNAKLRNCMQRAATRSTHPVYIFRDALQHLANERLVVPRYSTMQDLVGSAVEREGTRLTDLLEATMPPTVKENLTSLLNAQGPSPSLNAVKHEPKGFGRTELAQEVARRKFFEAAHAFAAVFVVSAAMSNESVKYYASLVHFYSLYKLRRMADSTARLYLLCFAFHRFRQINDNLIEAFIHIVGQFDKQAKIAAGEVMYQALEDASSNLKAAGKVLGLFVDESIAADSPFSHVQGRAFDMLAPKAFPAVSNYLQNVAFDRLEYEWAFFSKLSRTIKQNLRHLFCELDFDGRVDEAPLSQAITFMQSLLREKKTLLKVNIAEFPIGLIPSNLKRYILGVTDGKVGTTLSDVDRYEFLVYRLLRNALESGDLYVNHSNEFRRFEDDLISDQRWRDKEVVLAEVGLPILQAPIMQTLASMRTELEARYVDVNQRVTDCVNEHIKISSRGDKKHWALIYPTDAKAVDIPFYSQLPGIGIADLMRFVAKATGFLNGFSHVVERNIKQPLELREALGCVVAYGTNMGLGKMSEVSGLSRSALETTARSYLRPETLKAANDLISNATAALPAFSLFNIRDEIHSSSDGQRFETQIDTFNARHSPKYFGLDKGVSACTLVANHVPINARVIGTHEHESHFVFDLLFNNTSDIQPTRHSTDTHGANQVNFLILYTFGHAFAPRYKGLHRKTAGLVGFDSPSQYPETMLIRPAKRTDEDLIIREWPNVQRILASLAQKETTQATIVRKLSSYARQNQTQKAMWELDSILRSMYVLDFIDDVELRKGVYKALNRGEAFHRFRRAIGFAHGGKFKVQTEGEQQLWNECSRLIANAVIYYNTMLLSNIYEKKRAMGDWDAVAYLRGMSPVAWQHVNMFGTFEFTDEEPKVDMDALAARYMEAGFWNQAIVGGNGEFYD